MVITGTFQKKNAIYDFFFLFTLLPENNSFKQRKKNDVNNKKNTHLTNKGTGKKEGSSLRRNIASQLIIKINVYQLFRKLLPEGNNFRKRKNLR